MFFDRSSFSSSFMLLFSVCFTTLGNFIPFAFVSMLLDFIFLIMNAPLI